MPSDIKLGDLASRAIRAASTPGGIKRIALNQYRQIQSEDGGVLGFVLDVAGKFFGFACKAIFGVVKWGVSTIWNWLCSAVQFVWTFDFNQSDEAMDKSLESAWEGFGGILGGAFGGALGWLIPGAIAGTFMFQFNASLAVYVLNEFGEEALSEIASSAAAVLRAGGNLLGRKLFTWSYKALRDAVMGKESDMYLSDADLQKAIENGTMTHSQAKKNEAGRNALKASKERKPWSFALKWEEYLETIDDKFLRNFVEEAWEEFWETVREAGSEICLSIEGFYSDMVRSSTQTLWESLRTHVASVDLSRDPEPPPAPA